MIHIDDTPAGDCLAYLLNTGEESGTLYVMAGVPLFDTRHSDVVWDAMHSINHHFQRMEVTPLTSIDTFFAELKKTLGG